MLGVREIDKHEKYLGLPTIIGKSKKTIFGGVCDRIRKKLSCWKDKLLSKPGKEVLLKAVIQAIPTYIMSLFRIPDYIIEEIHKLMSRFWWGSSEVKRKIHWQGVTVLVICGGVGGGAKGILRDGIGWQNGDGRRVRVWKDPWLFRDGVGVIPQRGSQDGNEELTMADLMGDIPGKWNEQKVRDVLGVVDVELALALPLPFTSDEDRAYWRLTRNGQFTIKSCY
ncbi:uncharacterized protein LOC110697904 [Chenopodium quinoa]|uniref:uncharacterized protein LOC110697904 n=1 Tax=Chenopodium quinoa TaxID=63459 RepID=UPI000B79A3DF|nr:uncharacterized protein LOC110697904 [Chenopodium quinoa]